VGIMSMKINVYIIVEDIQYEETNNIDVTTNEDCAKSKCELLNAVSDEETSYYIETWEL